MNKENYELRSGKKYLRDVCDLVLTSLNTAGLDAETIENLKKMINSKVEAFMNKRENLK